MNNVKALQIHNQHQAYIISQTQAALLEVEEYLQSEKFWGERGQVSVQDVLNRLNDVRTTMVDAMTDPYGMACDIKDGRHIATPSCGPAYRRVA